MNRTSLERALAGLDELTLHVLEVGARARLRGHPATAAAVARATGVDRASVTAALARLDELALVWSPGTRSAGFRPAPGTAEVLGPHPAGLGPVSGDTGGAPAPSVDLPDDAPPGARAILDALAWGRPSASPRAPTRPHAGRRPGWSSAATSARPTSGTSSCRARWGSRCAAAAPTATCARRRPRPRCASSPRRRSRRSPRAPVWRRCASSRVSSRTGPSTRRASCARGPRGARPAPCGPRARGRRRDGGRGRRGRRGGGPRGRRRRRPAHVRPDPDGRGLARRRPGRPMGDAGARVVAVAPHAVARREPRREGRPARRARPRAVAALGPRLRRSVLDVLALAPDRPLDASDVVAVLRWRTPRAVPPEQAVAGLLREAALLGVTGAGALAPRVGRSSRATTPRRRRSPWTWAPRSRPCSRPRWTTSCSRRPHGHRAGPAVAHARAARGGRGRRRVARCRDHGPVHAGVGAARARPGRDGGRAARRARVALPHARASAAGVPGARHRAPPREGAGRDGVVVRARRGPGAPRGHRGGPRCAASAWCSSPRPCSRPVHRPGAAGRAAGAGRAVGRGGPGRARARRGPCGPSRPARRRGPGPARTDRDGRRTAREPRPDRRRAGFRGARRRGAGRGRERRAAVRRPRRPAARRRHALGGGGPGPRGQRCTRRRRRVAPGRGTASGRAGRGDDGPEGTSDPVAALGLLREAIADGAMVWLEVVGSTGAPDRRRVRPLTLDAGRLRAQDPARDAELTVAVHRIASVTPD